MNAERRTYGAIIMLSVDERNPAWMFAGFRQGNDVETYEIPDLEIYTLLARYLVSAARARLAGGWLRDRDLVIWKDVQSGWQVESE